MSDVAQTLIKDGKLQGDLDCAGFSLLNITLDISDLNIQPLDADLTAIAALTTTAFGRALLTKADEAAVRTYIGTGTSSFDGVYTSLDFTGSSLASLATKAFSALTIDTVIPAAWIGTTATTAAAGNDSRLTNTRTPTAATVTDAGVASDAAIAWSKISKTSSNLTDIATRLFSSLQSLPTTRAGYGITDAVGNTGNESISGVKTFNSPPILGAASASTLAYIDANKNVVSLATPEARGMTSNVWIGMRTDSLPGTGTEEDPFDGSTATKFRDIINSLPDNIHVYLSAGTFITNGGNSDSAVAGETKFPNNIVIEGKGTEATIIQLEGVAWPAAAPKWCVVTNATDSAGGMVLRNLTIDANGYETVQLMPDTERAILCVSLHGSNNLLDNVVLTRMYGSQAGSVECFAALFSATNGGSNNHARNVRLTLPEGDYQAGLAFFGATGQEMTDCSIKNCSAIGAFDTGLANMAFVKRMVIDGNYTYTSPTDASNAMGAYIDTGTISDTWITNNVFINVIGGAFIRPPNTVAVSNVHIEGNFIYLKDSISGHSYGAAFSTALSFTDCSISRNKLYKVTRTTGADLWRAVYVTGSTMLNVDVLDNEGDLGMEYVVVATGTRTRQNRDLAGIGLQSLVDTNDVQVTSVASGSVSVNFGITTVVIGTALTGALTLTCPRNDSFRNFRVVDPKGTVTNTNTVSIAKSGAAGGAASINGVAGPVVAMNAPFQSVVVSSDGVSGGLCSVTLADTSVVTITSSATPAVNVDIYNAVNITALATDITSATSSLTGTPANFQRLVYRIKDDATPRNITWGASFEARGVALPTITTASKRLTTTFEYDSVAAKFGSIASVVEA